MQRILLFPLLIIICSTFALAQVEDYRAAYYVGEDGVRYEGLANYDKDYLLSKRILWKANPTAAPAEIPARKVREFSFAGEDRVLESFNYTSVSRSGRDTVRERRLGEVLTRGTVDLLRMERSREEYFSLYGDQYGPTTALLLGRKDGDVYRLERREKQVEDSRLQVNSANKVRVVDLYKGALRYMMQDWPQAAGRIENLPYLPSAIFKIINDYNRYKDPTVAEAELDQTRTRTKPQHYLRLAGGPSARSGSAVVSSSLAGVGYAVAFNPSRQSNALRVSVGGEYFTFFNDPVPNQSRLLRPADVVRFRAQADYLFTRSGKLLPYVTVAVLPLVLEGFRNNTEVVRGSSIGAFSFAGGGGVDVGRVSVQIQYDNLLGVVGHLGYRLF